MHLLILFVLAPFLAGLVAELVLCRASRRRGRWLRWLGPALGVAAIALAVWRRQAMWPALLPKKEAPPAMRLSCVKRWGFRLCSAWGRG